MAEAVNAAAKIARRLEQLSRRIPDEVGRALFEEAQIERTESMKRTPVEFGPLRASHEVHAPIVSGRDISVRITVGGPSAPYAIYVHENLEAHHPIGEAKFLESTLMESRPYLGQRVARRVDLHRMVR